MRIIGGELRRRLIEFPDAEGLRPTPDRVRETLFNWMGQDLTGRRCLDLFAGSGALGMEASSRGAAQVVMVEQNRMVFKALQGNIKKLALPNMALRNEDGLEFAARCKEQFDVIFLDPPFQSDYLSRLWPLMPRLLAQEGVLYVESGSAVAAPQPWQVIKQGKAGAVHYQLLKCETE